MDHLSACYFCGIALDEPLSEYPVVPPELGPADDHGTITLCPGCHRKLETVLEEVVAAVDDAEADANNGTAVDETSTSTDTDSTAAASDDAPTEAADIHVDPDDGSSTTDSPDANEPDSVPAETTQPDAEAEAEPETNAGADEAAKSPPDETAEMPASDTSTDGSSPDPDTSISALEYNKVMRLLQNREFPVDRDEIETVAANAYEMARSDCAGVIDLAIDRELLVERDGKLVKPD